MFVDCALASAHERLVKEAGGKLLKTQIIADLRLGWPPLRISTAKPPDLELKNQHHLTNHVESCGQFRSEVRQVADTVYETSSHNVGRNLGYLLLGLHTMAGQSRRGLDRYSLWVSEGFKVTQVDWEGMKILRACRQARQEEDRLRDASSALQERIAEAETGGNERLLARLYGELTAQSAEAIVGDAFGEFIPADILQEPQPLSGPDAVMALQPILDGLLSELSIR